MQGHETERLLALAEDESASQDELRNAVEWLAANGEPTAALRLAVSVWRRWMGSGELAEGRALLATALDAGTDPTSERAQALYADGLLAFRQGDQAGSLARNEEALEIARGVRDPEAEALALVGLSRVSFRDGDYARTCELAQQARDLVPNDETGAPLHLLAAGTRLAGDYDEADALYRESLEQARARGNERMVAVELHNLMHVSLHRGDLEQAERYFAEWTARADEQDVYARGMTSLNEAALAYARGERERASELLARATSTLDDAGIALDPDDRFEVDFLRERLNS